MKMTNKILTAILICMPLVAWGDLNADLTAIGNAKNDTELTNATNKAFDNLENDKKYEGVTNKKEIINQYRDKINIDDGTANTTDNEQSDETKNSEQTPEEKAALQKKVDDAQAKLDKAKETEQSTANRMLGGLTTAATGIGGMQLAQGLAEKSADSAADKDMDAYIAGMHCTYGDGKSVPFGTEPVMLTYGSQAEFSDYLNKYLELAADLKERKTALDMKPGIESEEILDRLTMGLYDDKNTGITGGAYASRYRAASGSEQDKKGIASDKKEAKTRMIAGGVAAGVGLVAGIAGNAIINQNDDGSTKHDEFKNVQLANLEQAKRLIELTYENDANDIDLKSCEKKSNVVISARSQDTYTCKYKDSEDKIKFEFDDLNESDSKTVRETLLEYFCGNKTSTNRECNKKADKVMYNK